MFLFILENEISTWNTRCQERITQAKSAKEKLFILADLFSQSYQSSLIKVAEEFYANTTNHDEVMDRLYPLMHSSFPIYRSILEEGMKKNEFKEADIDELTFILNGLLMGLGTNYPYIDITNVASLYKKAIQIFLTGISNEQSK
ncbi:TetR family transcriptional regulator C-terminal domain-containing protein [Thermoflavimicrobium dichotomicum]|uniref:QacR-like protein, C-terminal region n=1 Tax=Thermoflavimicrobium dichotomicum TaxID=46223 RepID=A0A1I3MR13_9BACL|nr:TetR family transcriptional regulator C-terminal domain-containing protein [Thermoflavimicrobium dichotomicum]SFI99417.1 QacR-like protein, C-terminal region [Thermoflavimicrobium dichotomicum]